MPRYAKRTTVAVEKSRADIEKCVSQYGADSFASGWDRLGKMARVQFEFKGLMIRIDLPLPEECTPQQERQRWRALLLVIKAKLEAVDSGISTFQEEFLAWVVTPDGNTLGQRLVPQLEKIVQNGKMPRLLPGPSVPATIIPEGAACASPS